MYSVYGFIPEFLISFEPWTKLTQHWLMCAPLGIYFKPITELMLLVTI